MRQSPALIAALLGAWSCAACDGGGSAPPDAADPPLDGAEVAPCPTGALGPDLARSGTRLCARFEVAPGGARKLLGFHDRELDLDCTLDRSSPTTARCLPEMPELDTYLDRECTQPVYAARAGATCGTYRFAALASNTSCPHGQLDQIVAIGAEVFPTTAYRRLTDGTCIVADAPATHRYFSTTPLATDPFAIARRVDDAAAPGRLHASRWQGDDGSSSPWFLRDEQLDTDCTPSVRDGARRCTPVSMGPNTFADATCTRPLGGIYDECAALAPGVLENPAFIADQFTGRLYRRGPAVTPATLYLGGGDTCSSIPAAPGVRYFGAGEEVPVASLAAYEHGPRPTGARIQPYAYSQGGVPLADDGQFFDSVLGARCHTGLAVDDSLRCLPEGDLALTRLYGDAQCQTLTQVLTLTSSVGGVVTMYALETSTSADACSAGRTRVVRPGAERTTPLYVLESFPQPRCVPVVGTFWDVGPDVPPADLVAMELAEQ